MCVVNCPKFHVLQFRAWKKLSFLLNGKEKRRMTKEKAPLIIQDSEKLKAFLFGGGGRAGGGGERWENLLNFSLCFYWANKNFAALAKMNSQSLQSKSWKSFSSLSRGRWWAGRSGRRSKTSRESSLQSVNIFSARFTFISFQYRSLFLSAARGWIMKRNEIFRLSDVTRIYHKWLHSDSVRKLVA